MISSGKKIDRWPIVSMLAHKEKKTQPVQTQTKTILWNGQTNGCQPKQDSRTDRKLERKGKTNPDASLFARWFLVRTYQL